MTGDDAYALEEASGRARDDGSEKSATAIEAGDRSTRPGLSLPHEIVLVGTICSAQLLTQAGLGQSLSILHVIGDHFGTHGAGQLSWYVAGYSLTVGTFILIAGRLGDLYGHKRVFVAGWLWYGVWSVLAGVSYYGDDVFFSVCRAGQGVGPALLLPNGLALLGRIYGDGRRKDVVFSLFGGCAPGGFALGAVFASVFAELACWAWAFWSLAVVCLGLAVLSAAVIPAEAEAEAESDETASSRSFDWAGAVTGVAGLVLVNVAWNQGPDVGWGRAEVWSLLLVGLGFVAAFVVVELRVGQALVPLRALTGESGFVLACVAAGWSSFGIWAYYLWQFLELLRGCSPLQASAQVSPVALAGMVAALSTGALMRRLPTAYIMLLAMLFFCAGSVLAATTPPAQSYWAQTFVGLLLTPWGMDMSFPAASLMLSGAVGKEHQGVAASLVSTVVNYSIAIGLGIAGTVASQVEPTGQDLLRAYRSAWYTGIALSGAGVVIALVAAVRQAVRSRL